MTTSQSILHVLAGLSDQEQQRVLDFARSISGPLTRERRMAAIQALSGSISPEDIRLMSEAIEAECERVESDGW